MIRWNILGDETVEAFSYNNQLPGPRLWLVQVIAAEAELDRQFRERSVTPASLAAVVATIAELQGELCAAHLGYHLRTVDVLTRQQIKLYDELRGYSGGGSHEGHPG